MEYSAIIVELFGVVCPDVVPRWLARHRPETEPVIDAEIEEIIDAGHRGVLSQEELLARLAAATGMRPDQIEREWLFDAQLDWRMVTLLQSSRQFLKIALLTNSPSPLVRTILLDNDLTRLFDEIVVSSEIGLAKPDRKAYGVTLAALGTAPQDTLSVDTSAENTRAAAVLGIHGFLFRSFDQLRTEASTWRPPVVCDEVH